MKNIISSDKGEMEPATCPCPHLTTDDSSPQILKISIGLICLVLTVYSILFMYRGSVIIDGERYFTLFDDAMISMRFAHNLATGHGLVWNPGGERVEGITNPLYTLYMAFLHLTPISESKIASLVALSGLTILILNVFVIARLACLITNGSFYVIASSAFLTAFYYPLIFWTIRGMELGLLTLLLNLSVFFFIRSYKKHNFNALPYLFLGIGILTRVDMVIPYISILLFSLILDKEYRSKHLALGFGILLISIMSQTAFRIYYFGDWFTNTYFLKLTGFPVLFRISRGLIVTGYWLLSLLPLAFLFPSILLIIRDDKCLGVLAALLAAQVGYSAYVGGDAWEQPGRANRYVTIAVPLLIILISLSLEKIHFPWYQEPEQTRGLNRCLKRATQILAVLLAFLTLNFLSSNLSVLQTSLISPLHVDDDIKRVKEALWLRNVTTKEATIGVIWAGTIPYFAHRYAIDLLGKNDKHISKLNVHVPAGSVEEFYHGLTLFHPGHNKFDPDYSIVRLKPDFVQSYPGVDKNWINQLKLGYVKVQMEHTGGDCYLLENSPNIFWEKLSYF